MVRCDAATVSHGRSITRCCRPSTSPRCAWSSSVVGQRHGCRSLRPVPIHRRSSRELHRAENAFTIVNNFAPLSLGTAVMPAGTDRRWQEVLFGRSGRQAPSITWNAMCRIVRAFAGIAHCDTVMLELLKRLYLSLSRRFIRYLDIVPLTTSRFDNQRAVSHRKPHGTRTFGSWNAASPSATRSSGIGGPSGPYGTATTTRASEVSSNAQPGDGGVSSGMPYLRCRSPARHTHHRSEPGVRAVDCAPEAPLHNVLLEAIAQAKAVSARRASSADRHGAEEKCPPEQPPGSSSISAWAPRYAELANKQDQYRVTVVRSLAQSKPKSHVSALHSSTRRRSR